MDNSDQLLHYNNRKIIFTVDGIHFICAIELKKINKSEFYIYLAEPSNEMSDGAFFSTDELHGGKKFENFSQKKPIAKIVSIDDSKIAFTWFGFYNTVTKERELLKKNANNNEQVIPVLLKNCNQE